MAIDPFACLSRWALSFHQEKESSSIVRSGKEYCTFIRSLEPATGAAHFTIVSVEPGFLNQFGMSVQRAWFSIFGSQKPFDVEALSHSYRQTVGQLSSVTDEQIHAFLHKSAVPIGKIYKEVKALHDLMVRTRGLTGPDVEGEIVHDVFLRVAQQKYIHDMAVQSVIDGVSLTDSTSERFQSLQRRVLAHLAFPEGESINLELRKVDLSQFPTREHSLEAIRASQEGRFRHIGLHPRTGPIRKSSAPMPRSSASGGSSLGAIVRPVLKMGVEEAQKKARSYLEGVSAHAAEESLASVSKGNLAHAAVMGAVSLGTATIKTALPYLEKKLTT